MDSVLSNIEQFHFIRSELLFALPLIVLFWALLRRNQGSEQWSTYPQRNAECIANLVNRSINLVEAMLITRQHRNNNRRCWPELGKTIRAGN